MRCKYNTFFAAPFLVQWVYRRTIAMGYNAKSNNSNGCVRLPFAGTNAFFSIINSVSKFERYTLKLYRNLTIEFLPKRGLPMFVHLGKQVGIAFEHAIKKRNSPSKDLCEFFC